MVYRCSWLDDNSADRPTERIVTSSTRFSFAISKT